MDDAEVRREARRRKILRNSEKRLQMITRCKLEEYDQETATSDDNKVKKSTERPTTVYPPASEIFGPGDVSVDDQPEDVSRLTDVTNERTWTQTSVSLSETHARNRIWKKLGFKLVILAIIVRIIHIFKLGYLFGETIVIPFALFMMTQLGSCQFDRNVRGNTSTILFFVGMTSKTIRNILICYNVVTSILVYFGIYFFTFVCTHLTFVMVFGL